MTPPDPLPTGIERDPSSSGPDRDVDAHRVLRVPRGHYRLIQGVFRDASDLHDTLVREQVHYPHRNERIDLRGNVFALEDRLTGEGRVFLLRGPLPHARPEPTDWDFRMVLESPEAYRCELNHPGPGMEWRILEYDGGERGRLRALAAWQRSARPGHPRHHEQRILSNTWGDRSRDSRMNQAFMEEEIRLAAGIGIEVVQLDDGWQKGMTVNSSLALKGGGSWEGFWNADPEFWTPHAERFPNGLEPLVDLAREKGVDLGLWFAPDSWNDFANWERDADCLADLHRRLGVAHFKLDGIKCHSARAYANLERFIEALREKTDGAAVCDLDITAEVRPGPFGLPQTGVLFVENRYTDWHSYWPHHTLRNLWTYARWVDPLRLRFEMLNPERNRALYGDDPLAPSAYAFDALAATVLAGQPLCWFEISGLSDGQRAALRDLLSAWKPLRKSFFSGTVLPIGECPEGWGCSGFLSVDQAVEEWIVLLFRGLKPANTYTIPLPVSARGTMRWSRVAGEGEVSVDGEEMRVELPNPLGYVIGRLRRD